VPKSSQVGPIPVKGGVCEAKLTAPLSVLVRGLYPDPRGEFLRRLRHTLRRREPQHRRRANPSPVGNFATPRSPVPSRARVGMSLVGWGFRRRHRGGVHVAWCPRHQHVDTLSWARLPYTKRGGPSGGRICRGVSSTGRHPIAFGPSSGRCPVLSGPSSGRLPNEAPHSVFVPRVAAGPRSYRGPSDSRSMHDR